MIFRTKVSVRSLDGKFIHTVKADVALWMLETGQAAVCNQRKSDGKIYDIALVPTPKEINPVTFYLSTVMPAHPIRGRGVRAGKVHGSLLPSDTNSGSPLQGGLCS